MAQLEGRLSTVRGESLPNNLQVALPVKTVEELDALDSYLENTESKKLMVI